MNWLACKGYSVMYRNPRKRGLRPRTGERPSEYRKAGLSLVELLIALAIMGAMAAMVAGLSQAATSGWLYSQGHADATQHARVSLERMMRTVREAYATADHPGCVVVYSEVGSWRFPDTLVVWAPEGEPQNPDGPPLASECVMYCPDPADPSQLVEIRAPSDSQEVPLEELNDPGWASAITAYKNSPTNEKVILTDLLRTSQNTIGGARRGAIRFERDLRPSNSEWTAYQDPGVSLDWADMSWPQELYGSNSGTRNVWIRVEMQVMPGRITMADDPAGNQTVIFFDSANLLYTVEK